MHTKYESQCYTHAFNAASAREEHYLDAIYTHMHTKYESQTVATHMRSMLPAPACNNVLPPRRVPLARRAKAVHM